MIDTNMWLTQKKISVLVASIGILVVLVNISIYSLQKGLPLEEVILSPSIFIILVSALTLLLTRNLRHRVVQYIQISLFLVNGTLALLSDFESFNGIGFMILVVFLFHKYGLLKKKARQKLGFLGFYVLSALRFSLSINGITTVGPGVQMLLYLTFFLSVSYLCYSDEIQKVLNAEKKFKKRESSLKEERDILMDKIEKYSLILERNRNRVVELENMITNTSNKIDLNQLNITTSEEKVIRELCLNTSHANKEIAACLGISEGAVKQHLSRIFKKLNVRSRQQLIEICRENYF